MNFGRASDDENFSLTLTLSLGEREPSNSPRPLGRPKGGPGVRAIYR